MPENTTQGTSATTSLNLDHTALGLEFGSTRIKAILIDKDGKTLASGSYTWENSLVDGVWSYGLDDVVAGMQAAYTQVADEVYSRYGQPLTTIGAIGISGMMHGYIALDEEGNWLVPFRTWRNTITADSSRELSQLFGLNIPQRWTISHIHRAITTGEAHVPQVRAITTLAGYIHWRLTGEHIVGVGEASGIFPIGADGHSYDATMLDSFDEHIIKAHHVPWNIRQVLPHVAVAGEDAGVLTEQGAALLDPRGTLSSGIPLCPPEGDAGTGMVATGALQPRTGNVSAGTSAFAMIVLDKPLRSLIEEIDLVSTPSGAPVAMAHANNCTSDLNAWVEVFGQFAQAIGAPQDRGKLFDILLAQAQRTRIDEAGVMSYNFLSGDALVGLEQGRPLTVRKPDAPFSLAGLMRSHLFALFASMAHGVRVLRANTDVAIDSMHAHGGIFKTPEIPQRVLAAAFDTPVTVSTTASEGGAWGMALLAGFLAWGQGRSLEDYVVSLLPSDDNATTLSASPDEVAEYRHYLDSFIAGLRLEEVASDVF